MPLNEKGKELLKKLIRQYGLKKGKSVFYAMENSRKLKRAGPRETNVSDISAGWCTESGVLG